MATILDLLLLRIRGPARIGSPPGRELVFLVNPTARCPAQAGLKQSWTKQTPGADSETLAQTPPDYSKSLFLPRTDFPMRGGLPKKEPELLARWHEIES